MEKKKIGLILGIMCFLLTVGIVIQYKTVNDAEQIVGSGANGEMKTQVLKLRQRYEELYKQLEKSEEELENQREIATNDDESSQKMQLELKTLNSLIGSVDVKGDGIIITVADNKNVTNQSVGLLDNISDYLIHDSDLLSLVNELKNAGAEAISINDERIINNTAITCDGNVVLINGNKVGSPFVIKAIGFPELILGAIQRPGGLLEELNSYGLVTSVETQNDILIYKYNGIID